MKLIFRVLNTHLKGLAHETDEETIRIGRGSGNDLTLRQSSISRHHAEVVQRDGVVNLKDRGSKNTTEVDGRAVDGARKVENGSILTLGDVYVQVSMVQPAGQTSKEDEEVTPGGAVSAVLEENMAETESAPGDVKNSGVPGRIQSFQARPGSEITSRRPEEERSEGAERKVWGVLALLSGIAASVMLVMFFINYTGLSDAPSARIGTSLRVGEVKIVEVPAGFVHSPVLSPTGIAEISRTLNLNIAVTVEATSQGIARAELFNPRGDRIFLYINVHRATRDETAGPDPQTPQERLQTARETLLIAESLRIDGRAYEAKELYAQAVDILHAPGIGGAALRMQRNAERKRSELEEKIEKKHGQLRFETSALVQTGRKREALRRLEDTMELISDPNDIRHQNANMLHRLLSSIIE